MLIFDKGCAFYFQRDIRCFVRPCPEALCTFFFQGQRNRVILGCKQEASTQLPASRETSWESSQRELYVKISNITFASVSLFSCLLFKPTSSCFKEKKKKILQEPGEKRGENLSRTESTEQTRGCLFGMSRFLFIAFSYPSLESLGALKILWPHTKGTRRDMSERESFHLSYISFSVSLNEYKNFESVYYLFDHLTEMTYFVN